MKDPGLFIEYVPLAKLKEYPHNPKLHSQDIGHSIKEFGFVDPIIVDERTGVIVAGHGRREELVKMKKSGSKPPKNIRLSDQDWEVPVVRGAEFKDENSIKKFIVSHNLLSTSGGWDIPKLENIIENVIPFGADALPEFDLKDIPKNVVDFPDKSGENGEATKEDLIEKNPLLDGVRRLDENVIFFPSEDKFAKDCAGEYNEDTKKLSVGPNWFDIPNIDPSRLVEDLPSNLKVWGGRQQTPDDGQSYYLWNYGAVPEEGVPAGRNILAFWTHDLYINPWWTTPAFKIAEYITTYKGSMVVTPDCSIWDSNPRAMQIISVYKAQWMARFFQETGMIKVIPRLEFFKPGAKRFSLCGVPFEAPIVAVQFHTKFIEEDVPQLQKDLEEATKLIRCKKLLAYVSERGKKLINDTDLACDVIMLDTAKKFRVPKKKIEDPELLELRKRKRDKDPDRIHIPDL